MAKLGPGARIGDQFNLIRKIGEGGCGEVYLAEQTSLERNAVVKLMHPELSRDASYVARFRREAKLAASLTHHHTAAIYAFGETPERVLWIAMEYIEGESLHNVLAKEPAHKLGELLAPVADVLDRAGTLGIIHRDVKPDNIIVSPDGPGRRAVLLDFGLARPMEDNDKLTAVGVAVGSPTYMSPEQVFGPAVDSATDRYALGIILYIAVAKRPPFRHDDRVQLVLMHKRAPVPELQTIVPSIGRGHPLDQFFTRALAKQPQDRYLSARQMISEFMQALDQSPLGDVTGPVANPTPAAGQRASGPPRPVAPPPAPPPPPGTAPVRRGPPPPPPGVSARGGEGERGRADPAGGRDRAPAGERPREEGVSPRAVEARASRVAGAGASPGVRTTLPQMSPPPSAAVPGQVRPLSDALVGETVQKSDKSDPTLQMNAQAAQEEDEEEGLDGETVEQEAVPELLPGHRRLLVRSSASADGRKAPGPASGPAPRGPALSLGLDVLCATEATLGKHRDCDLVCRAFPSPEQDTITHGVSRQHARLRVASGKLVIEDLSSLNGTYVDDKRLSSGPVPLYDEARIRLGPVLTIEVRLFRSGAALLRRLDPYHGDFPSTLLLWDKLALGEPALRLVPSTGDSITRWGTLHCKAGVGEIWWGGPAAVKWQRRGQDPLRPQALQPGDRLLLGSSVVEWDAGSKPGLT